MPAQSKSQQRFFGVVKSMQKGDKPKEGEAGKIAKRMSKKDVDKYAKTKHKGLPSKVKKEQKVKELIRKMVREELAEAAKRDYKAEYKKFQSSTKSKKYRAELNAYNRKKGTYGNGDKKDASHKGGKIVGFEAESKNRGRREKSRLKKEGKLTEDKFIAFYKKDRVTVNAKSLWDAKKQIIAKLKVPKKDVGLVSVLNKTEYDKQKFRFEQKLRESIREIIKEQLNEKSFGDIRKIKFDKKDGKKIVNIITGRKYKLTKPLYKIKGKDIELHIPKKEYNKAVEFFMKNKLNPRG